MTTSSNFVKTNMNSLKCSEHGSQGTYALKGFRVQYLDNVKFVGINEQIYHLHGKKTLI